MEVWQIMAGKWGHVKGYVVDGIGHGGVNGPHLPNQFKSIYS